MSGFRRAPLVAGALLAASVIAALSLQSPRSTIAADQTVQWFVPTTSSLTVSVGDTVTWDWSDGLPHSVTSVTAPVTFDSGVLTGDDKTFAFTFDQAGTYTYRCNIHPSGMTGTVVVEVAQATATATAPATATASPTTQPTTAPTATTPLAGARTMTLSAAEEVPPITTSATGSFQWKLDGQTLSYALKAHGAGLTMAHIHLGDKGANGPVVAFLFGPNSAGVTAIDAAGTISVAQLTGPLAGDMAAFIAALNKGGLYVNVHSTDHPAGVLRGQIPAVAGTPGAPATGTGSEASGSGGTSPGLPALAAAAASVVIGGIALTAISRRRQAASR